MRTLVGYSSRTGNTKFVAEKIAEQLEADLCEVVDKKGRNGKCGAESYRFLHGYSKDY
jgi:flavodoxin